MSSTTFNDRTKAYTELLDPFSQFEFSSRPLYTVRKCFVTKRFESKIFLKNRNFLKRRCKVDDFYDVSANTIGAGRIELQQLASKFAECEKFNARSGKLQLIRQRLSYQHGPISSSQAETYSTTAISRMLNESRKMMTK